MIWWYYDKYFDLKKNTIEVALLISEVFTLFYSIAPPSYNQTANPNDQANYTYGNQYSQYPGGQYQGDQYPPPAGTQYPSNQYPPPGGTQYPGSQYPPQGGAPYPSNQYQPQYGAPGQQMMTTVVHYTFCVINWNKKWFLVEKLCVFKFDIR